MKKKTGIIFILSLLFFWILGLGVFLLFPGKGKVILDETVSHQVVASGGTAASEAAVLRFDVVHAGSYSFYTQWQHEPGGMLTGLIITDSEGNIVLACSAEWLAAGFAPIWLKKGTYTASFRPIANDRAYLQFLMETGTVLEKGPTGSAIVDFQYAENGIWNMEYQLQLRKSPFFSTNAGLLFGILGGILLALLFLFISITDTSLRRKYDERQLLKQRNAYKYAGFSMIGFTCFLLCWIAGGLPSFAKPEVLLFLIIFSWVLVYAVCAIWNDAYFALNENRSRLIGIFVTLTLLNLLFTGITICNGKLLTDGELNFRSLNLFCGILSATIITAILLKMQKEKREQEE